MKPMKSLINIKKFTNFCWAIVSAVVFFCFSTMLILMVLQVVFRYVLRVSVPWTDELARSLYIWQIFLGAALAHRYSGHIQITILLDRLSIPKKRIFDFIIELFNFMVSGVILYGSIKMMSRTYGIFLSTIPISFSYVYLALALGIGGMFTVTLGRLYKQCRGKALFAGNSGEKRV